MAHLFLKNFKVKLFFIALTVLMVGSSSFACKRTPESAEAANRAAIIKTIEADKDLNGFKVVRITHKINIYSVKLKQGVNKQTVKYEVIGEANCQVDVRRLN